ncbi:MAG: UvrB/UvrC motif-containing protein [Phycisphaerales bacterium]
MDLTDLLREWPYESGSLNVRLILGSDGEPKVQMRVDLGVLQMELCGRPDGKRPEGHESLLEYFEARLDDHAAATGEPEGFTLEPDDCRALREEAAQYYHRYISLLVLGDFQGVIRDSTRNLRLMDFVGEHGESEEDRQALEQFRPYITMIRSRAIASQAVHDEEGGLALWALDEGLESLRKVFERWDRAELFEESHEVALLRGMKAELQKKLPSSVKAELKERLRQAIANENYELAAILRDELKMMKD